MVNIKGKIIKSIGGFYHVETPDGVLICRARGLFRLQNVFPCAGDECEVCLEENNEPVIVDIDNRKNELIRPPLANLDAVFLVVSTTEPNPNAFVLDKLIFILESKGIEPVLVFTKTDKKIKKEFIDIYERARFTTFLTDNVSGKGTEAVLKYAENKLTAFIGNSGVGKSSLLNNLLPTENLGTAEISKKLGRGRHTTRQVELYKLPTGGYIADTPGFSTVEAARYGEIPSEEIGLYFREIKGLFGKCEYADCHHTKETGCAVITAVESGGIAKSRYDSYVRLFEETKVQENTY